MLFFLKDCKVLNTSDYDSDFDSVTGENQPLEAIPNHCRNLKCVGKML